MTNASPDRTDVTPGSAIPANALAGEIQALLAKPSPLTGIDIDLEAFRSFAGASEAGGSGAKRTLLPDGYQWKAGEKVPRVPLQLCEFLAYKTSLAYESEERIKAFLDTGHEGITRFKFFTSSNGDAAGKLADAQGYGFVFEGKAFVIFRGTESGNDWGINSLDVMTDDLASMSAKARKKLDAKYGRLLHSLGEPSPGRHVGFSIAWAAIKPQVEDWLADVLDDGDVSAIVYSGHSLGGAMAQVAAFDHARKLEQSGNAALIPQRFAGVVTFGAPMVGGPAFAEHYRRLLGDRTVIVESSGDLVPRIMQRWYYRMLYPLRQWVIAGVNAKAGQDAQRFASVAPAAWMFSAEPPLSANDIDNAITELRRAAERALRDAAEAEQKAQQGKGQQTEPAQGGAKSNQFSKGSGAGAGTEQNVAGQSAIGGAKGSEPSPNWVIWVFAGAFIIVGAGVAWYFVRRKLYSHDIEQRYALYLSTLSYQQLRGNAGGDLARANAALDDHLRFVRGDTTRVSAVSKQPYFKSVLNLPVKIELKENSAFVEYLKSGKAFL